MLTINDTSSLPAAAAKYEAATETISGYPSVTQGTKATGLLVNGRYQVKVLSRRDDFKAEDRAAWLQKFDLAGLAQLEPAPTQANSPQSAKPESVPELPNPLEPETEPVLVPQPAA